MNILIHGDERGYLLDFAKTGLSFKEWKVIRWRNSRRVVDRRWWKIDWPEGGTTHLSWCPRSCSRVSAYFCLSFWSIVASFFTSLRTKYQNSLTPLSTLLRSSSWVGPGPEDGKKTEKKKDVLWRLLLWSRTFCFHDYDYDHEHFSLTCYYGAVWSVSS